ncbi:Asp-tRNA(Asn)/Glu-tRNA(Gln) amidotransferase subunit GatC [Lutibacter sp. B2]|nr:Asp-tRNA(Asn)/Glu-tRNA(Gln) amidotransferase subunit GatC [Lutibacter sp. B2]
MSIRIKDVEQVAERSRLSFTEEEKEGLKDQLNNILEHVKELDEVKLEGVEPTYNILEVKNVFREDKMKPSMDREEVLMNASDTQNGCFKVPKVVE